MGTPDGLTDVKLIPLSRHAIQVKGKGSDLHLPAGTLIAPLTAQLVRTGGGVCWGAIFNTIVSSNGRISATSD